MTFETLPKDQQLVLLVLYAAERAGCKDELHKAAISNILASINAEAMNDEQINAMRSALTTDVQACRRLIFEERWH